MVKKKKESYNEKVYSLQGDILKLKEKYTFGEWQKIMSFLKDIKTDDMLSMMELLLNEEKIKNLLSIIVAGKIPETLYEDDFPVVNEIINDFFLRKNSLIKTMQNGS